MSFVVLDYETRSEIDLKTAGAFDYAKHPSTEIICASFQLADTKVESWCPLLGEPVSTPLRQILIGTNWRVVAHNAFFEWCITNFVLPKYAGSMREIPFSRFECTAARSAALALPRSLEGACQALNLNVQKDTEGRRLVLKYCKPRKPTKSNPAKWHSDETELRRLIQYCETDVKATTELYLKTSTLNSVERNVWLLDQKINARGFRVDRALVKNVLDLITREEKEILKETTIITKGVLDSPRQVAETLSFVKDVSGHELTNLQAKTVSDAIKSGVYGDVGGRVLELRQDISRASTAKYKAFDLRSRVDGRAKDNLLYWGASTGRWAGRGIQVQNLPRPLLKDFDTAIELVNEGDLETIALVYGSPMKVFSSLLRSVIIPSEGRLFYCGDYSAIEARVLFWVAKHEKGLKAYADNRDLYREIATHIYGVSLDKVTSEQRDVGKRAILGCFEENTPVLTDKGWVPIVYLDKTHKLWDGTAWVNHGGVVDQGEQNTMFFAGIGVTPDHLVLTRQGWASISRVLRENIPFQRSMTGLAYFKLKVFHLVDAAGYLGLKSRANVIVQKFIPWICTIFYPAKQPGAIPALKKQAAKLENNIGVMRVSYRMTNTVNGCLTGSLPRYNAATIQEVRCLTTVVDAVSLFLSLGAQIANFFLRTWCSLKVGTCHILNLTGLTTIKGTSLKTFGFALDIRTCLTEERLLACKAKSTSLKNKTRVYDVLNCGPLNRFTILTNSGPVIVHNCGYGMGAKKFEATCAQFGQNVSRALAETAVDTYRNTHFLVPRLWSNLENAARKAIENPGTIVGINRTKWSVSNGFLWCELPSKRRLAFARPSLKEGVTPWGEPRLMIHHWAVNPTSKKWENGSTYGGKLTENVVQAVARDLMAQAMLRVEGSGFEVVLSVHDELLCEGDLSSHEKRLDQFNRLMSELPEWAKELPVKVDTWCGDRYRK